MIVMILVLLMGSLTVNAFAQDLGGKVTLGVSGGGIFPKDSDNDNTSYIGGNLTYGINEVLAIGVEAGYASWEAKYEGNDYGDMSIVPLFADLYLRAPIELAENMLVPYVVGGIGVIFWDFDESSYLEDQEGTIDMDAELGYKLGGGFDYYLTDNFAINVEGSYVWSDADATAINADGDVLEGTFDTDYCMVTGGFKYQF